LPNGLIDRPDRAASFAPADLIKDVLASVRLNGALFLRAEYTSPWAYESPPSADLTRILQPGAKRLILFHIIAEGECWVSVDRDRLTASAGDVIVHPYAEQHVMGSVEEVPPVPIASLLPTPPSAEDDGSKAIPLRFEAERAVWDLRYGFGQHRRDRRHDR
jgi:hypothetical protein